MAPRISIASIAVLLLFRGTSWSDERIVRRHVVRGQRVERRDLEAVARERETELQRIDKDKALEVEKREIANVVRERVAVDKTVAEQEEAIKTLRVVEDADRTRQATVISAEAEAQELLVKDVKAAEAGETAAQHEARRAVTLADGELQSAERQASAQIRLAEGQRAEVAAEGLAQAQVKEADATATEKMGTAEARALEERYLAEARGLLEKAQSMNTLDDKSRNHEEYRLAIEKDKELGLEGIMAHWKVAEAQARLIQEGLRNAKIDIVGGESVFFDRLVGAIANGKSVDGFIDKSQHVTNAASGYLHGDENLMSDIKEVLTNPRVSSDDVQNLTIAALLGKLMGGADSPRRTKLGALLEQAKRLGVDQLPLQ